MKMKHLFEESSNYDETHNPALPDKKKPWCLNCRLHTDWHSIYKSYTSGGRQQSTRTIACNVCDGLIYRPIGPTKVRVISIAFVVPCFLLGFVLVTNWFDVGGRNVDEEMFIGGLMSIALGIVFVYMLRSINKDVRKMWGEFHKWAEEQSES